MRCFTKPTMEFLAFATIHVHTIQCNEGGTQIHRIYQDTLMSQLLRNQSLDQIRILSYGDSEKSYCNGWYGRAAHMPVNHRNAGKTEI